MKLMAEGWTEERLDDLKGQVERLERRTGEGFRELREEMDGRFDRAEARVESRFNAVDKRFNAVDGRFNALDTRLDAIQRVLILFLASMFGAMVSLAAALLATQV
jgi:hypothetical protein